MNIFRTACALSALLFASASAIAAPVSTNRVVPLPGYDGAWVYDGRTPPTCNARDIRVRHFEGDGHSSAHADHAHLGHGHKWRKHNFKGYMTKPPCYVRRAADLKVPASASPASQLDFSTAGLMAANRHALSGDLS